MQNMLDYLDWRGDLTFEIDGLNEVDNLILSMLAYLDFGGIVSKDCQSESISLMQAAERVALTKDLHTQFEHNSFLKNIPDLLLKASKSKRFCDIHLSGYECQFDYDAYKQFAAIVFSINNDQHFIAFRGTDDTLVGWQEDLQMSFKDEVESQKQAVVYMNKIAPNLSGDLYIGGHSKGGNLAVYSAINVNEDIQNRIIRIFNNDGPGFHTNVVQCEGYQNIVDKIITIIPKFSVVGMLFEHEEACSVVDSSETLIMQHNAFSWEVKGTKFVYEKCLTKNSLNLNSAVRAWLNQLSMEERARFVYAVLDILKSTGAKTVTELTKEKISMADAMIKTYKNMDTVTQEHLKKTIEMFFGESQKALRNSITKDISSLLSKNKSQTLKQVGVKKYEIR